MQEGIYHDNFKGHDHPLVAQNKAILARHNALVEAVAYHLELTDQHDMEYLGTQDKTTGLIGRVIAARAEVDRLIANADDCEGEE